MTNEEREKLYQFFCLINDLLLRGEYLIVDDMMLSIQEDLDLDVCLMLQTGIEPDKFRNRESFREKCIEFYTPEIGEERVNILFVKHSEDMKGNE